MFNYFTLQFLAIAEMKYFHYSVSCVSINRENTILVKHYNNVLKGNIPQYLSKELRRRS